VDLDPTPADKQTASGGESAEDQVDIDRASVDIDRTSVDIDRASVETAYGARVIRMAFRNGASR
jgi:hypothetical protein